MAEISKRTSTIVSLVLVREVILIICSWKIWSVIQPSRPVMRGLLADCTPFAKREAERVRDLTAFKQAVADAEFPGPEQSIFVEYDVVETFIEQIDSQPK